MTHDFSRSRSPVGLLHLLLPLVVGACGGEAEDAAAPEPTVSREAFISTYVDLRMAALRRPDTEITRGERERILEEHGVSSGELLRFVEVLSRDDPRAMQEVWAEIQDRVRRAREESVLEPDLEPQEDTGGPNAEDPRSVGPESDDPESDDP
ncbi:MAG: hypothetical protein ACLFWG_06855, partial [Longimicrobiales bacterium]